MGVTYHPTNDGKHLTMNKTFPLCLTEDEYDEYTAALERAIEFVEDEETCDALNRLVGALEGAHDAATM